MNGQAKRFSASHFLTSPGPSSSPTAGAAPCSLHCFLGWVGHPLLNPGQSEDQRDSRSMSLKHHLLIGFSSIVLTLTLPSCGVSMQLGGLGPISRTPKANALLLEAPIVDTFIGGQTVYPAGRYPSRYQDSTGTYYQSDQRPLRSEKMRRTPQTMNAGLYLPDEGTTEGMSLWLCESEIVTKRKVSDLKIAPPRVRLTP